MYQNQISNYLENQQKSFSLENVGDMSVFGFERIVEGSGSSFYSCSSDLIFEPLKVDQSKRRVSFRAPNGSQLTSTDDVKNYLFDKGMF